MKRVIFILCDTLRAKSLPHYGGERNPIPNLFPIISRDFVVYKRAYSPASWTIPSHLSIFTGLHPTQVMETRDSFFLNPAFTTLADLFKDSGFHTAALIANTLLANKLGYDKGFNEFFQMWLHDPCDEDVTFDLNADNDLEKLWKLLQVIVTGKDKTNLFKAVKQKMYKRFINNSNYNSTRSTNRVMRLLKKHILRNTSDKLFYFINLLQTHDKYNPPSCVRNKFVKYNAKYEDYHKKKNPYDHYAIEPFSKEFMEYIRLRYEEEILYLDLVISDLIKFLQTHNLYDDSIIIITSDHGEQFGEHGRCGHSFSVYESLIRIPLYIKWQGRLENINKIENKLVMLQDLYSTFSVLLNHWQPCPLFSSVDLKSSHKRSWTISQLPKMSVAIKACVKKRQTFSIKELGLEADSLTAYVLDNGIKIIENGSKILCYDLNNDPDEERPFPISPELTSTLEGIKDTLV